jgi:hypothetical protein
VLAADLGAAAVVVGAVLLGFLAALIVAGWGARSWLGRLHAGRQLQVQL